MRRLLIMLPAFSFAITKINAEYMQGSIDTGHYQLKQVSISNKPWYLSAKTAEKVDNCWLIYGAVQITNNTSNSAYNGEKFKYCQDSNLLSSETPVTVIRNNIKMQAKKIIINLKKNQAKIYGITANASN